MYTHLKYWHPYISPFDPCPPMKVKSYSTPPHLYMNYQPYGLPQFSLQEALCAGTLWPALYDPYKSPYENPHWQPGVRSNES